SSAGPGRSTSSNAWSCGERRGQDSIVHGAARQQVCRRAFGRRRSPRRRGWMPGHDRGDRELGESDRRHARAARGAEGGWQMTRRPLLELAQSGELDRLYSELGSWKAVALHLGVHESNIRRARAKARDIEKTDERDFLDEIIEERGLDPVTLKPTGHKTD